MRSVMPHSGVLDLPPRPFFGVRHEVGDGTVPANCCHVTSAFG